MHNLAARPNIYIKMSAFFDMFNATGDESAPWTAPKDVGSYRAHFDVLMNTFGDKRLIWGSNWPVCTLAGTVGEEVAIAEGYLSGFSKEVRDNVMFKNAKKFYHRHSGISD
jgi:predicted TIM-barrel fold metal-dependent hydrolase